MTGKVEVGQNTRTALTQAVAEELRIGAESVNLVMGDTAIVPYNAGTFGSQSTPQMAPQMRRVAATAREMLLDFAAEKWHADRASLTINEGRVMQSGSGRSASFGELTRTSSARSCRERWPSRLANQSPRSMATPSSLARTNIPPT